MSTYELYMKIDKNLKRIEKKIDRKLFMERILNYVRIL